MYPIVKGLGVAGCGATYTKWRYSEQPRTRANHVHWFCVIGLEYIFPLQLHRVKSQLNHVSLAFHCIILAIPITLIKNSIMTHTLSRSNFQTYTYSTDRVPCGPISKAKRMHKMKRQLLIAIENERELDAKISMQQSRTSHKRYNSLPAFHLRIR